METPCAYKCKLDFQEHFIFCISTHLSTANKAFEGESSFEGFGFPAQTSLQRTETAWYCIKLLDGMKKDKAYFIVTI